MVFSVIEVSGVDYEINIRHIFIQILGRIVYAAGGIIMLPLNQKLPLFCHCFLVYCF